MSSKKIQIGSKPTGHKAAGVVDADVWVAHREQIEGPPAAAVPSEKMKRLTIDVPEKLHRAIKRQCADQGMKIADVARELLREWVDSSAKS